MRKVRLDNKGVICRGSSLQGFSTNTSKAGLWGSWNNAGELGNSSNGLVIGRIASIENDGLEDCKGWIVVYALSQDATFFMERWVNPAWVTGLNPLPRHIRPSVYDIRLKKHVRLPKEPNRALAAIRASCGE